MPWEWHPKWLERVYHAAAPWHLLVVVAGELSAYFFGQHFGHFFGWAFAAAVVMFWLLFLLVANTGKSILDIIALLKSDPANSTNVSAAKTLRGVLRGAQAAFWVVLLALIVSVAPVLLRVWSAITTKRPESIRFANLNYHKPIEGDAASADADFVQGLVTLLRKEGQAAGKPYRVAIGESLPLGHFTPEFECTLEIAKGKFQVVGYAFRVHEVDKQRFYEPVAANYAEPERVEFKIPRCQTGDRFFVVIRIIAPEEPLFPENPVEEAVLKVKHRRNNHEEI